MIQTVIRPARLDDAEALQRHCYVEASLEDVQDYLAWCLAQEKKGRILRLVAEVEGEAVANAQLTLWGKVGEIGSVVVSPAHRRQGLARQLITRLVDEARQRALWAVEIAVEARQPAILAFYRELGFEPAEEQKNGLSHPVRSAAIILLRMGLSDEPSEKVLGGKPQTTAQNDSGCDKER